VSPAAPRFDSRNEEQDMRDKIKLVSSAGVGYFYTTKNKDDDRKAEDGSRPEVRKHVEFVEEKLR
jgi:large subunit ribosomal protein L33